MRVLVFTSLYPSTARPRHGIFVESRLAAIQSIAGVEADVIAPIPWFPATDARFGEYAHYARTAREETRLGNQVLYPRYLTVPCIGMYTQPLAMASAAISALRKLNREGKEFDVIDAHYFYPDGVAAAIVAQRTRKPLVVTARGSDVNLLAELAWPRRKILWAARQANAIVTVSSALSDRLRELGADADKIHVVRNGVDTDLFTPVDRREARARLGLTDGPVLASIGNLVSEKGHDIVIDALTELPGVRLVIVGDGPQRRLLESRIDDRDLGNRVIMLPARPQVDLKWIYGAVDALVLASSREGLPNVVLEAIACGTPVIATRVGGIPEVITDHVAGALVDQRTPQAFARAIREVLASPPARVATRRFAERFDWATTARGHLTALERAIAAPAGARCSSGCLRGR